MTPLAAVAASARAGALPRDNDAARWLRHPAVAGAAAVLAAGEIAGDKLPAAPDRTVPPGLVARLLTGGLAGAALAPRRGAAGGALLGALGAIAAAYPSLALRKWAMRRFGQTVTGLVEDAVTLAAARRLARR